MDDVLTEAFIRQCPMFAIVFRELIKNNNIEQLYKDNHYEISKYYTNEYEFDFDTTILEILLKILYDKNINHFNNPFYCGYGDGSLSNENLIWYLDFDLKNELHILDIMFGIHSLDGSSSYVYHNKNNYNKILIARKFSFKKEEIEPFIAKLNYTKLDKMCKKLILEKKLNKNK